MENAKVANVWIDGAIVASFALVSLALEGWLHVAPRPVREDIAVVFPPWIGSADAISRAVLAGADVVGTGRFPFIVIVRTELAAYRWRVAGEGALFALDLKTFGGCISGRESK